MDPLAQLQDIHLPEAINHYPIAIGWWLLAALLLLALIITVIRYKKAKQKRYYQQLALKQLSVTNNASDVISLLKGAALQYFPRHNLAKLHGEALQAFLASKLPENKQTTFNDLLANSLANLYKAPSDESQSNELTIQITQAAHFWLTHALPPKETTTNIVSQNEISGENT